MDAIAPVHGWTLAEQVAFLGELGRTGVVERAAQAAGRTSRCAYQFRLKPAAEHFRLNWAAAAEAMYANLLQIALTRIAEGTPVDIVRKGEVVGQKTVHDNRLLTFLLTHLKGASAGAVAGASAGPAVAGGVAGGAAGDPLDRLHAGLDAFDLAILSGDPLPPLPPPPASPPSQAPASAPDGSGAPADPTQLPQPSTPAEHDEARTERLTRAYLRMDDFAEQERDRAACSAEGRDWVPRAFKPLPPLRWYLPPTDDLTPSERYHRLIRRFEALAAATTDEEREAAANIP